MESFFIIVLVLVVFISFIMYFTGYSVSVISGTGGIISSSMWIFYLWKTGALEHQCPEKYCNSCGASRKIEFMVAVTWLIFSIYVIMATPYDAPPAQSHVGF